jgi:outer membrane protein insertion porin family
MRSRKAFKFVFYVFVLLAVACISGCRCVKYLPKGDTLYTGSVIHIESETVINKKDLSNELEKVERPKPNSTFLGMRPKLWVYDITGKDPGKGVKHWLITKVGEPPVLASELAPSKTAELMKNRLQMKGYFHSKIAFRLITKNQKTKVVYDVQLPAPYLIHKIIFPTDTSMLSARIRGTLPQSLLKEGERYDLDLFKTERIRIDHALKDSGFFYFNPDYLLFRADSVTGSKLVNITLTVKPDAPAKARIPYIIGRVYLMPYPALTDSGTTKVDTIHEGGYYYLDNDSAFRPKVIVGSVFLKTGDLYSRKNHNTTLGHLMGMGVFKFVSIRFEQVDDTVRGILNVYINMSPMPGKSVQAELEAVTKSNNYTGPALTLSFKNRNLFQGAEMFVFNLLGSFETQLSGTERGLNSYEFGANAQLYFPKFVSPFKMRNASSLFVPKTKVSLGYRLIQRIKYFNMEAFDASFGYKWKENARKEHELDPVSITLTRLNSTTPAFNTLLQENSFLRKSFQEQFIIGSKYSFTYNTQIGVQHRNQYYFNGTIDVAGNALHTVQSLIMNHASTDAEPYKIFGYPYSQYSRGTVDGRYYLNLNKGSKIAARVLAGIGLPYGNSSTMPYTKQFFSGGSNSIRAFQARSLGPGSYSVPDSLRGKTFLDQSGDIKLEGSLEYRFGIISVLKGALFTDAGNVWLLRKNSQFPGGEFDVSRFQEQIAVGAGFGLRIDLSFFVLRFDLALPLRKPFLPENERWVVSKIAFGDPSWRRQNLVLNIAVGYPF